MRKPFLFAQEAYDETGASMVGMDTLLPEQTKNFELVSSAINTATEHVSRLITVRHILRTAKEQISLPARKMVGIVIGEAQRSTGISFGYAVAQESSVRWKTIALEGLSQFIDRIIEAIKKAVAFIWKEISELYQKISSTARRNEMETIVRETMAVSSKIASSPTRIKDEDLPFINDESLLRDLDIGEGRSITEKSVHQLIENLGTYFYSIRQLSARFRVGIIGLNSVYDQFKKQVQDTARTAVHDSNSTESSADFLKFRQDFYNQMKSTVDEEIREHFNKANVSLERNLIEGLGESNPNGSTKSYDIQFTQHLKEMRMSVVIGGLTKLYFVLYDGEYENFEAIAMPQTELSRMKAETTRYLSASSIVSLGDRYLEIEKKTHQSLGDIDKDFKYIKMIIDEILSKLQHDTRAGFEKSFDPQTSESFSQTIRLLLELLRRYQMFSREAFYKSVVFSRRSERALSDFFRIHFKQYNVLD